MLKKYTAVFLFVLWISAGLGNAAENSGLPKGAKTIPTKGPYAHHVESATSPDGLAWTRDQQTIAEHASVPCAIALDAGRILVYYVDASQLPETINGSESLDGGKTWKVLGVTIEGLSGTKAVDPSIVKLPDGRLRLYYFNVHGEINQHGEHSIYSAVSDDGVHFKEEKEVYRHRGLVDPDIFWTGTNWRMYVYNLHDRATIMAQSEDGLTFQDAGTLPLRGWGTVAPVSLGDKRFRLYAFEQPSSHSIHSFTSTDLIRWVKEGGVRLTVNKDENITDPFPVKLIDGSWKMFFKVEPAHEHAKKK